MEELTPQPSIKVTIFDHSQGEKCQGHCGLDLTSPEVVESITELLRKRYGEKVQLEYLDLAEPLAQSLHPELVGKIRAENLPLPSLFINNELRISGYFDIYLLQSVIQAEMEMWYG